MSGVTWVYIMLGLYIVYCFYVGLKGYFTDQNIGGLRRLPAAPSLSSHF
jgi:SSS family solute:Na+ symporter